mgnify:CR=1 FL=1
MTFKYRGFEIGIAEYENKVYITFRDSTGEAWEPCALIGSSKPIESQNSRKLRAFLDRRIARGFFGCD